MSRLSGFPFKFSKLALNDAYFFFFFFFDAGICASLTDILFFSVNRVDYFKLIFYTFK